jgi:hypothetical protein
MSEYPICTECYAYLEPDREPNVGDDTKEEFCLLYNEGSMRHEQ